MVQEVIYKYPLEVVDSQVITLTTDADVLTVQVQNNQPVLWALVRTDIEAHQQRRIRMIGTGHEINPSPTERLMYLSTIQLRDGALVLHVFEQF